jgi:hypothetical protein
LSAAAGTVNTDEAAAAVALAVEPAPKVRVLLAGVAAGAQAAEPAARRRSGSRRSRRNTMVVVGAVVVRD